MKIEKELARMGITPLNEITAIEKNILITQIITSLVNTFPMFNSVYNELCMKLYCCNMYRAIIDSKLNKVNYFYKNRALYFDETLCLDEIDKNIIHECVHYLQDIRKQDKKLYRIGLSEFNEYKVIGLGLNEFVLQYIAQKIIYHVEINKENTDKIYLYVNTLLNQIIFILGEETLISSAINATQEFKDKFMDAFQEEKIYYQLTKAFDKFLEKEQENNNSTLETEQELLYMHNTFERIQYIMFQKYFDTLVKYIDSIEEIEDCKNKMLEYRKIIFCNQGEEKQYDKYIDKKIELLDKKILEICRKNSRNTLVVLNNNPIVNLLNTIKKVFFKNETYKEFKED